MSEQNTPNGTADLFKKAWRGFQGAKWTDEVNVREFIQNNYTQYDGNEDFLAAPTEATEATTEPPIELGVPDGLNPADTAPVPLPEQMVRMYALDDSVARQLMQKGEQTAQPDAESGGTAAAHAPTVAPAIEERDDRLTLLLVALGAILIAAAGGAAACAYYQKQYPRKERGKA